LFIHYTLKYDMMVAVKKCFFQRLHMRRPRYVSGFTLIEMAILCVLAGILMMGAMSAYNTYAREKRLTETYDRQDTVASSIASFAASHAASVGMRYPCPAPIRISLDDPKSGVEDCSLRDDASKPVPSCDAATGICKIAGRPTDLYPDGVVLIGGIPYKSIKSGGEIQACFHPLTKVPLSCADPMAVIAEKCHSVIDGASVACDDPNARQLNDVNFKYITQKDIIDSWGQQMLYAVTSSQTDTATYKSSYGAISVETENANSLVTPPGSAHYVIVSSGENKTGSYSVYGNIPLACNMGSVQERENCDGDALFISGLLMADYDDIVSYRAYAITEVWRYSADGQDIYNLNDGNIGVGIGTVTTPEEKLDVGGSMRVVGDVKSENICPQDGTEDDCWSPALLGGEDGLTCKSKAGDPPGTYRVLTGIKNKKPVCSDPIAPLTINLPARCPDGMYIQGFYSNGNTHCAEF
jgi:type II secretory pathway pseudopilin PulG